MSEKPKDNPLVNTDVYMAEMEMKEARECEEKKKDPYGFEMEKLFEEDMEELENIMDEQ